MKKRNEQRIDYWQSYSDMMAALLLIFVLIIAVAFMQLQKETKKLEEEKNQLLQTEKEKEELEEEKEKLEEEKKKLEKIGEEYIELEKLFAAKEEQLQKVVGIKAEIIEALQKEFEAEKLQISIDSKSGSIRFQSEILFATDKSELTNAGKKYLRRAIPVYLKILLSDKFAEYVSEITIEGNCDSTGTYEHNLILSQDRARTVATFCIGEMKNYFSEAEMEELLKLMNISGRSNKNIIYDENNQEDLQASRRVEVKFRLKDEEMIEEMLKILEDK